MEELHHPAPPFSANDLRRRAAGKLLTSDEATTALASPVDETASGTFRPAAILIPVIDRTPEATVLLTRRTDALSVHAGQISFPGGKMEQGEATPAETVFREVEEEIGLGRRKIDLLGFLECFRTDKNFGIYPLNIR